MGGVTGSLGRSAPPAAALLLLLLVLAGCGDTAVLTELRSAKRAAAGNLGTAGNYVILAKTGISGSGVSAVTGDVGTSPAGASSITGLSLVPDSSGKFSTSTQVVGKVYAADYAAPTPAALATAVSDMQAASAALAKPYWPYEGKDLGGGDIGGMTILPGLYEWGGDVTISADVTFKGGSDDVWILDAAGFVMQATGTKVILSGGALAKHIFWVAGCTIGSNAQFAGIVLGGSINVGAGALINGRLFATNAITLNACTITQPAP